MTYVDHDPWAIGRAAMRRVLEGIGGPAGPPQEIFVDTVLVPRGSGEITRSEVRR